MKRVGNPGSVAINHESHNPFENTSKEKAKIPTARKAIKQKSSNQNQNKQTTLKQTSKLTTPQKLLWKVSSERTSIRGIKCIHMVQLKQLLSKEWLSLWVHLGQPCSGTASEMLPPASCIWTPTASHHQHVIALCHTDRGAAGQGIGYLLLNTFMYLLIYWNWYKTTNFHFLWFLGSIKCMKLHFYASAIKIWGVVNDNNQTYGFCWFEVF